MASKARPGAASGQTVRQPDDRLIALEGELSRNVLELELIQLRRAPASDGNFEDAVSSRRARITELYGEIADTKPKTLAGAAVLLRRVPAMLGDERDVDAGHLAMVNQLIDTALAVVEKNAS